MSEKRKDNKGRILKEGESQRKNGSYQYRYRDIHGTRRYVYANTLDDLREEEKRVIRDQLDGIDYALGKSTVRELAKRYIEQRTRLKKSTISSYKVCIKLMEKYGLCDREINAIKKSDVISLIVQMHNDGYKYSTIYSVRALLFSILEIAVDDDVLRKNPAKVRVLDYIADDSTHVHALTKEQTESFLNFIRTNTYYKKYYDIFVILLETGLRISEAMGLTMNDVDFEHRCIHVNHQLIPDDKGKLYVETPKSEAGTRDIPMSETARWAFARIIAKNENSKRNRIQHIIDGMTGFVFLDSRGKPRSSDNFSGVTRRAVRHYNQCHEEQLRITPHVFRHTFCTNLSNANVSPKSIMYVMGHNSLDMLSIYDDVQYDVVERELRERVMGE